MKHTPGPWKWGKDWSIADKVGSVYYNDGDNSEIQKYMDMELIGRNGQSVIPLRIDHYEMIYDGKPITKADRDLIAASPELLEALKAAQAHLEYCGYGDKWERECAKADDLENKIEQAISKAEG